MLDLAVLISGGGSNLKALLDACNDPAYPARIVFVASDTDAAGLDHARAADIPTQIIRPRDFDTREAWALALAESIQAHSINSEKGLVVSAGLMRILPAPFVDAFSPRLINTHPALLPLYPGAHAVRDALADGASETGATVHIIDAGVDTGPTLRQVRLSIREGETESDLHERIKALERPMLVETVRDIALGTLDLSSYDSSQHHHPPTNPR